MWKLSTISLALNKTQDSFKTNHTVVALIIIGRTFINYLKQKSKTDETKGEKKNTKTPEKK